MLNEDDTRLKLVVPKEFDFTTNTQRTVERFPTPRELWERYLKHKIQREIIELGI
jgi:hypothetical protein